MCKFPPGDPRFLRDCRACAAEAPTLGKVAFANQAAVHGYATAVDGDWGPVTDGKVRTFQTLHGLTVDGIVNVPGQTWEALIQKPAHPTVRPGYEGGFVAVLQRALNAVAGVALEVDGRYGVLETSPTRAAIQAFQQANSLEVDGVVGQSTWAAIDRAAAATGYTVA